MVIEETSMREAQKVGSQQLTKGDGPDEGPS